MAFHHVHSVRSRPYKNTKFQNWQTYQNVYQSFQNKVKLHCSVSSPCNINSRASSDSFTLDRKPLPELSSLPPWFLLWEEISWISKLKQREKSYKQIGCKSGLESRSSLDFIKTNGLFGLRGRTSWTIRPKGTSLRIINPLI